MLTESNLSPLHDTDSLIFDLDGTLWDASETCAKAWTELLQDLQMSEYSIDGAAIRAVSGLSIGKVFKDHFTFIPEDRRDELINAYKPKEAEFMSKYGGDLYPGVKDVLKKLGQKYRLFVVSNCLNGYIQNFITFHNLDGIFTDFECSGKTGLPKSENIKMIVERNNLLFPVYIGDTVWDFEASQAAGVPFIFASYGFGNAELAERQIESFNELEDLFLTS